MISDSTQSVPEALAALTEHIHRLDPSARERPTVDAYIKIGAALIKAKALVSHGHFANWVAESFGYAAQWRSCLMKLARYSQAGDLDQARRWAALAAHPKANATSVSDVLAMCDAYKASTLPASKPKSRASNAKELREVIERLRRENDDLRSSIARLSPKTSDRARPQEWSDPQ